MRGRNREERAASQAPAAAGAIVQAQEGQVPPTPDGRQVTIKVDRLAADARCSHVNGHRGSAAGLGNRVHLHQHEDEIILNRAGSGVATLGDRDVAVSTGAIVYVPQGLWHGLRNYGTATLGMSAIYSPPGFEQALKDRLLRPNRTAAEAEASRKKHGIVYRDPPR